MADRAIVYVLDGQQIFHPASREFRNQLALLTPYFRPNLPINLGSKRKGMRTGCSMIATTAMNGSMWSQMWRLMPSEKPWLWISIRSAKFPRCPIGATCPGSPRGHSSGSRRYWRILRTAPISSVLPLKRNSNAERSRIKARFAKSRPYIGRARRLQSRSRSS